MVWKIRSEEQDHLNNGGVAALLSVRPRSVTILRFYLPTNGGR